MSGVKVQWLLPSETVGYLDRLAGRYKVRQERHDALDLTRSRIIGISPLVKIACALCALFCDTGK